MDQLWNPARLALGFIVLCAIFVPVEALFPLVRRRFWQRSGVWADLVHFFITGGVRKLLTLIVGYVLILALGFLVYPPLQHYLLNLPRGVQFLLALLVFETGTYWGHRWAHEVPMLWKFHAVHHSSAQLDWLAAARLHPIDQTFVQMCGILPVYLLGFTRGTFGFLIGIGALLAIGIHANVRWRFGWLEYLVATPAFHHWHHANEGRDTVNRNYTGLLPCIDMLFGTFHLPDRFPVKYGIDDAMPTGYFGQILYPFRSDNAVKGDIPCHVTP